MGSYDNDWLFLDDDLFCVWFDSELPETDEKPVCDRYIPLTSGEDGSCAVDAV